MQKLLERTLHLLERTLIYCFEEGRQVFQSRAHTFVHTVGGLAIIAVIFFIICSIPGHHYLQPDQMCLGWTTDEVVFPYVRWCGGVIARRAFYD
jgi:hypothetical protein